MSKQDELTEKKIMALQYEVNKHMAGTLTEIKRRAKDVVEYAKANNYTPNKALIDILERSTKELDYLDVKGARLDDLQQRRIPKTQDKLDLYDDG
jgi:hypothetical protein